MARKWDESKVRRDGQGQFAHTAGGWLGKVGKAISARIGGEGEFAQADRRAAAVRAARATMPASMRKPVDVNLTPEEKAPMGHGTPRTLRGDNPDMIARNKRGPMTDAEFDQRTQMVTDVIGKAMKTMSTDRTHTNENGRWNEDRDRLHREIADELYGRAAHVPNERRAVIAGGLGGAGKTTVLTKHAGINPDDYVTLNPDDVKELMAGRGLIPEVPGHPDLSPMERAALVHEESSRITSLVADMALRDGKNMMWDITMSSKGSVEKRIAALKAAGYREVNGVFVDIPVEVSVSRAMSRYRRGADKHLAGKGPGGRFVPPAIIRAQRTSSGETINRGVFDEISGQFSTWSMYDNSVTGRDPQLIKKKRGR